MSRFSFGLLFSIFLTKAAEGKNAENLPVIYSRKLAELYARNWKEHEKYLEDYQGTVK
jgi:hypothetical protein